MSSAIGITFGNTASSIAVATADGKVDVIANPDGDRAIPSILSYVGDDEYHGAQAYAQLIRNPKNTIINFRDFIGRQFAEVDVSAAAAGAPAVKTSTGGVGFEITRGDKVELVTVEEAATRHFRRLKAAAEDYIGRKVDLVVLSVPTDFSEHQRAVLTKTAADAGLKVLQLVNEPSAALLGHLSGENADLLVDDKLYVVADFGGIRSDAAVVAVRGGVFTILSTLHQHGLGGAELDGALADYFAKEFEKKFKADAKKTPRSVAKLLAETIVAKKTLSNVQTTSFSIESLSDGFDFLTSTNRLRYELAARPVFAKLVLFVESAVKKAGYETIDVDEVLLVGGTSNTPKLASSVAALFGEKTNVVAPSLDSKAGDPSELVARGAALQASLVESFDDEEIAESLQPVVVNTQHLAKPIGIVDASGTFHAVLVAETAYPIKKLVEVTNGDASSVKIALHEGKRAVKETTLEPEVDLDASDDESDAEPEVVREVVYEAGDKLAELTLKDLKPQSKLEVIINITQNGTLHVSGRELKQGLVAVKGEVAAK